MNNKTFKYLSIFSLLFVIFILSTNLTSISENFLENISISLSDSSKMENSFIFSLLVSTKNIIVLSLIMNVFFTKLTTENTYSIIRFGNKKDYGKYILLSLLWHIVKINIFIIFIELVINIISWETFLFDINFLKIIFGNFIYLTFKYLILTLLTTTLSFYFSRNLSLIVVTISYILFVFMKNIENIKIYSPLNYLDFYRNKYILHEELARFILVLIVCICLIILFLRILNNRDIIYFRRDHE